MFVGRVEELKQLLDLFDLKKASLVVCRGRRRIGKSTLIQQFGKKASALLCLAPPTPGMRGWEKLAIALEIIKKITFWQPMQK